MHATASNILERLDRPDDLESLYHDDPAEFAAALGDALTASPDSMALRVWKARLEYRAPARAVDMGWLRATILIALAAAAVVRLPALAMGDEWYARFGPSAVALSLVAYFWLKSPDRRLLGVGLGLAAATLAWVQFLPIESDSGIMALVHLPVVFWGLLAVAFTGGKWKETGQRVTFLRYNGELLILGSLVALGGLVLSGITVALFEVVYDGIEEFYFENVGLVGAVGIPVVATWLYDVVFRGRTGIPTVLARVFAPLFLVMVTVYIVVAGLGGQNPFVDRSFLIICNALLLLVLGMSVLSITERSESARTGVVDHINVALIVLTLVIDALALSAILFRLASFGFTPNRVTVLGANLLIFGHLVLLLRSYVTALRGKSDFDEVWRAVTNYLPAYVVWAAVVAFVLPWVFSFA